MIFLHLVLTGVAIGALAESSDDQHHRQRKKKLRQPHDLNEIIKTDPHANWIARPIDKHSGTPGTSGLDGVRRHSTTEKTRHKNVRTSIPNTTPTILSKSPVALESWGSDLKRAVVKLMISVDNLNAALQDIKNEKYPNLTKHTNRIRNKRDTDDRANVSIEINSSNDTADTFAPDGGRDSNDVVTNPPEFQNGRRSAHNFKSVKDKLLLYLDEGFQDIGTKVSSLRKIKQQFANVAAYKIGYIVANVDTLAVSIKNLREESRRNRELWAERDILDVYDRLKISNSLITNLMDTLRLLMEDG